MATITSAQSGLASATTTWVGGVVPVEGDKVIIAAGHVVTLDGTFTWGDDSVTATLPNAAVNVYGTLKASRTVNSSLTGKGLILLGQGNTVAIDFGTWSDPLPGNIKASLILNKSATPALRTGLQTSLALVTAGNGQSIYMVSDNTRSYNARLSTDAAATSSTLNVQNTSSLNWEIGDTVLLFTTTDNTSTNECELRVITEIGPDYINITPALTYGHKAGSPVANMTRNILITSYNEVTGQTALTDIRAPNNSTGSNSFYYQFKGVEFRNLGSSGGQMITNHANPTQGLVDINFTKCTFRNTAHTCKIFYASYTQFPKFVDCNAGKGLNYFNANGQNNPTVVTGGCYSTGAFNPGILSKFENVWITGTEANGLLGGGNGASYKNVTISGVGLALTTDYGVTFEDCDLGYTYGWKMYYGQGGVGDFGNVSYTNVILTNCKLHSLFSVPDTGTDIYGKSEFVKVEYIDKNQSTDSQEIHYGQGSIIRDNSVFNRGISSIVSFPYSKVRPLVRTKSIPCANGQTVRVVGYVRMDTAFYNGGDCNLPTVSLSGLGATPVTFTATSAANNAWQQYDISITNTAGYDGNFTLTFTANAKTVTTGKVWFDGVPDAPFITKCRHYGFNFNETSPTVTVNPYTAATESVAAAYTGTTINATTKRVSFGSGTIDSLSKLYDYSQAWGCLNIDKDMPWTRAGALLSIASGWTVVQPTISGITWGGGAIELVTPGTITGSFDSNEFRFATAGTYDLSNSTFVGTVEFSNTSGGGVQVILIPANVNYVNNDPGTITIQPVIVQATGLVSGIVPNSRIQVYNVTKATEIANEIVTGTSWTISYPEETTFDAGDIIRVRLAYMNSVVAKLPVEYKTIAALSGWSVLADQKDDTIYNLNAIDGDLVTEFIADYPNVHIDISDPDGITTPQRGYAWYISGQMTADGIRYYHGAITAEDAYNYRVNVDIANMHMQNVNTAPVMVIGARIYRSDGSRMTVPGNGTIEMEYGRVYAIETGVSGLTPSESSKLLSLNTDSVNVAKINNVVVSGNGTENSPWGP